MLSKILESLHQPVYRRRIAVLADLIASQIRPDESVLDIGCGNGELGAAILANSHCPRGVSLRGLEKARRGGEPIEVIAHATGPFPMADRSVDVVILADVLHHEVQEMDLLAEAVRICRRIIIIKDHTPAGLLGHARICLMDWAANHPHRVKCLFRYHTAAEWHEIYASQNLKIVSEELSIDLYPAFFNWIFGKRLQYFAVVEPVR